MKFNPTFFSSRYLEALAVLSRFTVKSGFEIIQGGELLGKSVTPPASSPYSIPQENHLIRYAHLKGIS